LAIKVINPVDLVQEIEKWLLMQDH
jgi:hypothetical protein